MGFFDLFKNKKKSIEDQPQTQETQVDRQIKEEVKVEKEKVDLTKAGDRIRYIERLHESIQEARRQCQEIKFEYGRVTSFLKDIQIIDQAPPEEKQDIYTSAFRIVELLRVRQDLQKKRYKMTDAQKRALEIYEDSAAEDIKKLLEYEDYQIKIKNDLRQLSAEKAMLLQDKDTILRNQRNLKSISKILIFILLAAGSMLLLLLFAFKVDIAMPFVATSAFAFIVAAMILNEARKNRIDMVITEKKANRAISLSNKVKIKYVNNVKALDYICLKYEVRSATELDFVYGQYLKAKREWEKQRESTKEINENNAILISELRRLGVKDCEIWFNQAVALVDPREMVEVRHALNVRRRALREQLEYNTQIMEDCLAELELIREKKPEYAMDVERVLGGYSLLKEVVKEGKED
ncbi:MAG: hypothetical protein K6G62_01765 [Eubacterium sp.]|nr:hypothetical protein [Eubacterium sp.]